MTMTPWPDAAGIIWVHMAPWSGQMGDAMRASSEMASPSRFSLAPMAPMSVAPSLPSLPSMPGKKHGEGKLSWPDGRSYTGGKRVENGGNWMPTRNEVSLSSFEFQVFYDFYGLLWFSMCFLVFQEGSNLSSQVSGTVADSMELG